MTETLQQLGNMSTETFLREYWQQKPLLIRQAFAGFQSPLSPDEMAGLSLEEEIESRIILENHEGSPWQLRCGPFSEEAYQNLPEKDWTLLVQAVDHWVPELAELLKSFSFLPSWRLDDIMASYAVPGGSVGPHYDHYDVFLLQGMGQRRWQLGQYCDESTPLLQGTPLNILKDFDAQESWVLEPGDMLYLPPQYAHWGTAVDDCITYSIGFRAPNTAQLIEEFIQDIGPTLGEFNRYADPGQSIGEQAGEIQSSDIDRVIKLLDQALKPAQYRVRISQWFGRYMTEVKYDQADNIEAPDERMHDNDVDLLSQEYTKSPSSRFAFLATAHPEANAADNSDATLFANGAAIPCELELAKAICQQDFFDAGFFQNCPAACELIPTLIELQALEFWDQEDDDEDSNDE